MYDDAVLASITSSVSINTSTRKSVTEFLFVLNVIAISVPTVIGPILLFMKYEVLGYSYIGVYESDYKFMKAVPSLIVFWVKATFTAYPAGTLSGMLNVIFMYWSKLFIKTHGSV